MSWMVSPTEYSATRLEREPASPILTLLTAVMMSPSLRPALSAAESLMTAAVVIGFIDGFNPCAMWVLLFLISVLIGMKNRKRMWALGLTFLITSALVYMLIMLSWIQVAVKITAVIWIRNIIAIVAFVGGVWNLRSFFKSNDSGCEVVDDKRRKSIFKRISVTVFLRATGSFLIMFLSDFGIRVILASWDELGIILSFSHF